jgi:intracellular multiplication protein IcmW
MADLTEQGVAKFWSSFEDPMIYRVVTFMEGVEPWVLDGDPKLEKALARLSKELDHFTQCKLDKQDEIIRLCNSLKSGRTLRLLHIIDSAQPGSASKILMHAEEVSKDEQDDAGLFLRRNIVFERLRLLGRVFAPERLKLVMKALEEDDNE